MDSSSNYFTHWGRTSKTTKDRPEFNCSLKVENIHSLNEAAFPGIDMFNPLLGLLNRFRTDGYVLLVDLKKKKSFP